MGPNEEDIYGSKQDGSSKPHEPDIEQETTPSPEQREAAKNLAAITSMVFASLGTARPGEKGENTRTAISQALEIQSLANAEDPEYQITVPSELILELQTMFSHIKDTSNFLQPLNSDAIDIIEKILSQHRGFAGVGFEERQTPAFLEATLIKALGGKKKAQILIGHTIGKATVGLAGQEIKAQFNELRKLAGIILSVQRRRWEASPNESVEHLGIDADEISSVLEILELSEFDPQDLENNPLTVDDVLQMINVDRKFF